MILNTKSLNELMRKLQEKPEIEGCFLTAKNNVLLSHHFKDNALYSSVSSMFNDSKEIIQIVFQSTDGDMPLQLTVKLEGISIIMKQAGGYYTFGCVIKTTEFAIGRMIFNQAWKEIQQQLKLVAVSITFA